LILNNFTAANADLFPRTSRPFWSVLISISTPGSPPCAHPADFFAEPSAPPPRAPPKHYAEALNGLLIERKFTNHHLPRSSKPNIVSETDRATRSRGNNIDRRQNRTLKLMKAQPEKRKTQP
jgi:hypothetical protein